MAITNQNDLLNARANKRQDIFAQKISIANTTVGGMCSMYRATGFPTQPIIPVASAVPTAALSFAFNNPAGADISYIDTSDFLTTAAGVVTWNDRVYHSLALNGTLISAQLVNSQSTMTFPVRTKAAANCEWWLEWYADTGATAVTANVAVTYTDTTTGVIAVSVGATVRAGRLLPIIPVAGKTIASVQSVTLSATTGAAGSFGVTCTARLGGCSTVCTAANVSNGGREAILLVIANDTCLMPIINCSTTSSGDLRGEMTIIQG